MKQEKNYGVIHSYGGRPFTGRILRKEAVIA
jgi:hypothetical protein